MTAAAVVVQGGIEFGNYRGPGGQYIPYIETFDEEIEEVPTNGATFLLNYLFVWRADCWRIPFWAIVVVELFVPSMWVRRKWKSRVTPNGACGKCGYDLTGNTSGVCPECGERIKTRETTSAQPD